MAYRCFACQSAFSTVPYLLAHIQIRHKTMDIFRCTSPHCLRSFSSFKSFKNHFTKLVHEPDPVPRAQDILMNTNSANVEEPTCSQTVSSAPPIVVSDDENDMENVIASEYNPSCYELRQDVSDSALKLAAKMYANTGMTRAAVQDTIEGMSTFLNDQYMDFVKAKVLKLLGDSNVPTDEIVKVKSFFEALSNPFDGLETEHLRVEALKESNMFVSPVPYVVGSEYVTKKVDKTLQLVHVNAHGQRVPMKEILRRFLQLPGALDAVLNNYEKLIANDEPFTNIVQGTAWRQKIGRHFRGKTVLPLSGYTDDFEPDNAIGAHSGDHKMCAFYYTISCLPPECLSRVENLFLGCFCLAENKIFGMDKVLKPIVDDLYELETEGIEVNGRRIYFALATVMGDNLGLAEVLGFISGFTGNFPCRICRVPKSVLHSQFYADASLLRNSENYLADVNQNDPSLTGVVKECIFNRLPSYVDPTLNHYCDLMHDVCEGVGKYDMAEILNYIVIQKKMLDIVTLNERIRNFDYSFSEQSNVVPTISEAHLKDKSIRMSSSELLTLIRYFSLMVGDYVDQNDPVWQFYLTLREIVDIITAPFVNRRLTNYLRVLIAEHHEQYVTLFNERLKPKFHFMVHYPDLLLEIGPLICIWCSRFESKHRPSKQSAHLTNSRRNLPFTLAYKHQLEQSSRFLSQLPICNSTPTCGPVAPIVYLQCSQDFNKFIHDLPRCLKQGQPTAVEWAEFKGTKYAPGMILVVGYSRELPRFGVIEHLSVVDNVIYFVISNLRTIGFDQHFYSYHVIVNAKWKCLSYKELVSHQPLKMITLPRSGRLMVCTRFEFNS